MKQVKKVVRAAALASLICVMLTAVAFAAGNGSVWLSENVTADGVSALIVTDTTVTDGLVKLTYDSEKLTYQDVGVVEEYVAMYSVNPDQEGVVLISWVAPEAYASDGTGTELIVVNFVGTADEGSIVLSGTVHDEAGNEIAIGDVDTSELEAAVDKAETLNGADYTEESFDKLEEALAAAEAVLADQAASQSEVDAAKEALQAAMDALVKKQAGSEQENEGETKEETSGSGNSNETGNSGSTAGGVDSENGADTGDHNSFVLPIILVVASVAVIVVMIILKKRGNTK